jgi:7,8-dihydro-6-hydroxymethylpterin-pyrophosphokinase
MSETSGPNFINACLLLETAVPQIDLKEKLIQPVETTLGRQRSNDRNAPRTIDVDVILVDDEPVNLEKWNYPFVVVPLAELMPDFTHPIKGEKMIRVAERMRSETWIIKRPKTLKALKENCGR